MPHSPVIHREGGQALVEFALVAPILFTVLFAVLSFGRAFNYWNDVTHLSAEGARYAAVNRKPNPTDPATLQQQIQLQSDTVELRGGGSPEMPAGSQVCVDFPNGSTATAPGDPVRVTAKFTFNWIPILGLAGQTITSTAVMRLEASPTNYAAGCS
jgi:TadE-like protein